jgi:hypothetical protein
MQLRGVSVLCVPVLNKWTCMTHPVSCTALSRAAHHLRPHYHCSMMTAGEAAMTFLLLALLVLLLRVDCQKR